MNQLNHKHFIIYIVLLAVVVLCTFLDYGISWDEKLSHTNGFLTFRWYDTFGQDRSALNTLDLYLYGALFDVVNYTASVISPLGSYETSHLLIALFGLLGIFGVYRLGCLLGDKRVGFLSAILLTATPMYYGHLFNNPKDLPFAVLFLWAIYFLFKFREELPEPSRKTLLIAAVVTGLTLGVRVGGFLLFGFFGVFWLTWLFENRHLVRMPTDGWRFAGSFFLFAGVAWWVMLLFWPYAQVKPLLNPILALGGNVDFNFNPLVKFDGELLPAKYLPWHYLPTWYSIRLPEFYFVALFAGVILASRTRQREMRIWLLLMTVWFPPFVAMVLRSTLYDGLRHFLFTIPPLAVVGSYFLIKFWDEFELAWARKALLGTAALSVFLTVVDMVRLHPYQYVYFNRAIAGGTKTAAASYDLDYWGHTVKEGTEWVMEHYADVGEQIAIGTCSDYSQVEYWIEKKDLKGRFTALSKKPHVYLHLTNKDCYYREPGKVLHRIERNGVSLLEVRELRSPS